jgi:Fe-S cluster assembly iron-binding protein IscA
MLTVTDNAAEAIRAITRDPDLPESAGLRIFSSEETGPELALRPAPVPESGDEVVANGDARVFLEPQAAALLGNQVLDAEVDPEGQLQFTCHPADSTNGSAPA